MSWPIGGFEVIPAIDLRGGKCVRLLHGDYDRETIYGHDPVAMARHWVDQGATRMHVVDLDGARAGRPSQLHLVAAIVNSVPFPVQLGGGLRTLADVESALGAGVERVVLGTAAILGASPGDAERLRRSVLERFGDRVVIGLDARNELLAVQGWTETTELNTLEFAARLRTEGFERIVFTDIARDGALQGVNMKQIQALCAIDGLRVVASGGVTRVDDLQRIAAAGAESAIIGRALYTGDLTLSAAIEATRGASLRC